MPDPALGPRPFYCVGHNPNSISLVQAALAAGANAIEPDVNAYADQPTELCIGEADILDPMHGCDPTAPALTDFLDALHGIAVQTPALTLVVFDCKPKISTADFGLTLLTEIRNRLTFDTGLNVILSVANRSQGAFFDSIRQSLGPREGLMIDEENDPVAISNYFAGVTIGVDWCLVRGSDANFQIFAGPGGGQIGGNWPAPGNTNVFGTFSLVLDTTTGNASSGWSMAVYTNGVLVVATNNVWSPNPAIQYVGLGADAATGNFRNFTLTDLNYEVIPAALSVTGQPGSQVLSWPSIYLGWILQSNSVGLQASNAWVTVPGSTATTQIPLTVNQNQSAVFYRLLAP